MNHPFNQNRGNTGLYSRDNDQHTFGYEHDFERYVWMKIFISLIRL